MKTAIKIAGLCLTLALASCGGGDSTTTAASVNPNTIVAGDTTAPAGTPAATPVVANTGTVTVNTTPGNIVSIGASGATFKTADAAGQAVFTGLPAGAVDVHVFKVDGTEAVSYYGLNSDLVNDVVGAGAALTSSQIVIAGSMVNYNTSALSGDTFHLDDGKGYIYQGIWDRVNNIVSFTVDEPVGTVVAGTLYANTYSVNSPATSSAGNTVFGSSEIVNLGAVSFTTVAPLAGQPTLADVQGSPVTATFTVTPAVPVLATINAVTAPAGMSAYYVALAAGGSSITGLGSGIIPGATGALIYPDTINAVGFPGANDYTVSAGSAGGSWYKAGTFTVGGTLSITAAMTNMPTVPVNQTGSTIMWTESTSAHAVNFVNISAVVGGATHWWSIQAASGVSSIVLPTVPAGVAVPLPVGTVGNIDLQTTNIAATHEQIAAATNFNGVAFEVMSTNTVAYTR